MTDFVQRNVAACFPAATLLDVSFVSHPTPSHQSLIHQVDGDAAVRGFLGDPSVSLLCARTFEVLMS